MQSEWFKLQKLCVANQKRLCTQDPAASNFNQLNCVKWGVRTLSELIGAERCQVSKSAKRARWPNKPGLEILCHPSVSDLKAPMTLHNESLEFHRIPILSILGTKVSKERNHSKAFLQTWNHNPSESSSWKCLHILPWGEEISMKSFCPLGPPRRRSP